MSAATPQLPVGRALARLSRSGAVGQDLAAQNGGESRAAILRYLERAESVSRVEEVAAVMALHPNTVRGHLDALMAAGRITRIPDKRTTRGRPHWLYAATSRASVRELTEALEHELDRAPAPEVARRAARAWAESGPGVQPSESPDAAVDQATAALTEFGFDAVRNPVGDQISLRACPYAALVRDHPVICDIHAALLGEVLSGTGQPVALERLDVQPRPGVCVAHLRRPDVTPEWSVLGPSAPADGPQPAPPTRTAHSHRRRSRP